MDQGDVAESPNAFVERAADRQEGRLELAVAYSSPRHTAFQKRALTRVVALAGIAAPVLLGIFQYYAVTKTPGYDWVSQTISALASPGTPHPAIMQSAIVAYHAVVMMLALTVWRLVGHDRRLLPGLVLMFVYAIGGLSTGVFQNDSPSVVVFRLSEGTIHDYSAYFSLTIFGFAVIAFIVGTHRNSHWHRFSQISLLLLLIGAAFAIPIPLDVWIPWHGVLERVVFALSGFWIALFSAYVYRVAVKLPIRTTTTAPNDQKASVNAM